MLQTQIQYWQLQEAKRNNIAQLQETARHNTATEKAALLDLSRKQNELMAQIDYWTKSLQEAKRHNKRVEGLTKAEIKTKLMQAQASLKQARVAEKNLKNLTKQANAALTQAAVAEADLSNRATIASAQKLNAETAASLAPYQQAQMGAQADKTGAEAQSAKREAENWYGKNYGVPILGGLISAFK